MKIKNAEIVNIQLMRKGNLKINFSIENPDKELLTSIMNFNNKIIKLDINVDTDKQIKKNNMITDEQRKKIYQLYQLFSNSSGYTLIESKEILKSQFNINHIMQLTREDAKLFIQNIIEFFETNEV